MNRNAEDWKWLQVWSFCSLLSFYGGLAFGTLVNRIFITMILAAIFLTTAMVVYFTHRKKHSWLMTWMVALAVPFLTGMAAATIWLDPEATAIWAFRGETVATILISVVVWTTILRYLPWKRILAWLSLFAMLAFVILGAVWMGERIYAMDLLMVALFFVPITIGVIVLASSTDKVNHVYSISLFGAFLLIYIIALLVITDGEGAGALEAVGEVSGGVNPKNRHKTNAKRSLD